MQLFITTGVTVFGITIIVCFFFFSLMQFFKALARNKKAMAPGTVGCRTKQGPFFKGLWGSDNICGGNSGPSNTESYLVKFGRFFQRENVLIHIDFSWSQIPNLHCNPGLDQAIAVNDKEHLLAGSAN